MNIIRDFMTDNEILSEINNGNAVLVKIDYFKKLRENEKKVEEINKILKQNQNQNSSTYIN